MHDPPLLLEHTIDRFAIHDDPVLASQQHSQPPIPECGMLLNPLAEPICPRRVRNSASHPGPSRPMQARMAYLKDPTTAPFRDIRRVVLTRRMSSGPQS